MGPGPGISCSIRLNTSLTPEQKKLYQDPEVVQHVLNTARNVVIYGLSSDPQKASYFVASYLQTAGYTIIPVNPKGGTILGQKVYTSLREVEVPVDVVDVFRPRHEVPHILDDAIAIGARVFWQQLRINDLESAERARQAGLISIVDLCMKMEHGRYSGGLHEAGMNTEIISAKRTHRWL